MLFDIGGQRLEPQGSRQDQHVRSCVVEITEVRVKLMEDSDDRLRAFCSITFDDSFVVRDLKIIDGSSGPFVAMPSRKLTSHCGRCGYKNHLRASYCNQCGSRLEEDRMIKDHEGRIKLYADVAHPINSACREMIQQRVIMEYTSELDRANEPGYVSRYDDDYDDDYEFIDDDSSTPSAAKDDSDKRSATHTQIQAAEPEPRGPHKPPTPAATTEPNSAQHEKKRSSFGDGIF
jgi:stage V sporulation protein G